MHEIGLVPSAQPIAKAPFNISPFEALELKNHLIQLLEQGFIKPGVSPLDAFVLFLKKRK